MSFCKMTRISLFESERDIRTASGFDTAQASPRRHGKHQRTWNEQKQEIVQKRIEGELERMTEESAKTLKNNESKNYLRNTSLIQGVVGVYNVR